MPTREVGGGVEVDVALGDAVGDGLGGADDGQGGEFEVEIAGTLDGGARPISSATISVIRRRLSVTREVKAAVPIATRYSTRHDRRFSCT